MKKYEIIKKNTEFNDIINTGTCFRNKYYYIYYKDNDYNISRFGLAVSKKCGNAVQRNKIKRQLKFMIDNNKDYFKNSKDYIIVVSKYIGKLEFKQMAEYFKSLFIERKSNEKI